MEFLYLVAKDGLLLGHLVSGLLTYSAVCLVCSIAFVVIGEMLDWWW